MSIQHYAPGEVINISPDGAKFESAKSETLIRESHIEVFRFILNAGKTTPEHTAAGAVTIQCIEGEVELNLAGQIRVLKANNLIYLSAGAAHTVKALLDSTLLITILLQRE
ncbi:MULTISPECIES: cupin domain-containing protein [unclassified Methylophilus]|uniref:Cupin n=1 Tax=Methylophilus methylotrophus TaxID=17 RepID=A0A5C7WJP5_METME|nr:MULTISPECIES: cupin domain-containing protein [unclassified Methylophilus]MBF4988143.1 cupin domain-containing protein [Methylophilus sp. 14]PPD12771.1 MAG: cupin [Methylophilus sp.]TXI37183.1 MAG: cupin [Methylophilus methylotrophus]